MIFEVDNVRQQQAALEAIEVLKEVGFSVGDFSVDTETEEPTFGLDVTLGITEDKRPLEHLK